MSTLFQGTKMMTRTTQLIARMFVVLLAVLMGLNNAAAQSADPYKFEKKAYKPDGTPWSGPVNVGDTVKYVLSYKPGTTNSGPVTIDDTLSPNQTYVAPTQGPGWTWGSSPYSVGNQEKYVNPGFGPGNSVNVTVVGNPAPSPGAGDGTIPIPILAANRVFGVFHHALSSSVAMIDCWDLVTLAKCTSAPKPNAVSGFLKTPDTPQAVVRGTNLYFLGLNAGGFATIGCFDGISNSACADTPLPAPATSYGHIAGLVEDSSGRVFAAVNDKLLCRQLIGTSWIDCAGWPTAGITTVSPAPAPSSMYILSGFGSSAARVYINQGAGIVQCIDTTSKAPCAGWSGSGVLAGPNGRVLSSIPAGSGSSDGGVCLWSMSILSGCIDASGSPIAGSPASAGISSYSTLRLPNTPKVFFPSFPGSSGPTCINYTNATGAPCAGFVSQVPTLIAPFAQQYGFAVDPLKPEKCMLSLGHNNFMWRFDYLTGEVGCGTTTVSTPPIDQLYCNGKPDPSKFQWSSVNVSTANAAGTLTITQGTNPPVTLAIASGTANYTMPSSIAPGYGPLTFSFVPAAGSPSSIDLVVGYTSDKNPEICYQAKVSKCGPVFNDAVFKGSVNGAPISVAQKVNLGDAKGPACDPKPPVETSCLSADPKVACGRKPGTYVLSLSTSGAGGTTPDFVSIIPTTAGVSIVNPQVTYPVIGGVVQITIAGATPGQALTFDMEGTRIGGGSAQGTDLCCNGKITVTIPKDLECETKKLVDLSIKKTGATSPAPGVNGYSFNLAVTNVGAPFNGTNAITITDAVPAGMTFNSATSPDWLCATLPASTGSITCTYTGAGPVSAGQVLSPIAISATANGKAPFPPFENCAVVGTLPSSPYADTNPANNKSCVTVKKPDPSTIKVTKVCAPAKEVIGAINSYVSDCKINVTTTGPQTSLIVVNEAMTGGGVVTSAASSTTPAWNCTTANCSINGSSLNQTSSTSVIDVQVKFNNAGLALESKNCAKLSVGQNPVPKPDGESCTRFTVTDTPFKLNVKKDCSGVIALTVNGPWAGYCKITVTATGGPRPPFIAFNEQLSDTNASHSSVFGNSAQQSADPWNCVATNIAGPLNCVIAGNAFPANGTSEILIPVQVPLGMKTGEAKNCVNAFGAADAQGLAPSVPPATTAQVCVPLPGGKDTPPPAGDGTISVTKTCDPAAPNGATNNWGAGQDQGGGSPQPTHQAICQVEVTGAGSLPPVIELTESMMSWAPAAGSPMQINILNMTSPQNWQFPPFPIGQGSSTAVPGSPYAGAPAIATLSSADLLAAGGQSTITVTAQFMNAGWASEAQNCVQASGVSTPGAAPGVQSQQVCVPFTVATVLPPAKPVVTVEKTCAGNPQALDGDEDGIHDTFTCQIKVTVTGGSGTGEILVEDMVADTNSNFANGIATVQSMTSSDPWSCGVSGPIGGGSSSAKYCSIPVSALSGGTSIINVIMVDGPQSSGGDFQNCAQHINASSSASNPDNSNLSCAKINDLPVVIKVAPQACDPSTATPAGDLCRCRFNNMNPVSKTACECKDGFTLKAGKGCVPIVVTPKCDPATTVTKGNACVCEYKNMVQVSKTACACAKGFKFAPGKGCFKPEPVCKKSERFNAARGRCEPVCAKGFDYNQKRNACIQQRPDCPQGTIYNAKRKRCDPVQPVCRKPFVYDPNRKACVEVIKRCERGTIPFRGKCVPVPKCPFGQIPIPGTGICVSIGGGGGGGPKEDVDRPKGEPGCVPTATRGC
jgi:hypothetical protein